MQRREDKQLGHVVQVDQFFFRDKPGEHHLVRRQADVFGQVLQALTVAQVDAADHCQLQACTQDFRQQGVGLDQTFDVFARVDAAGIKDVVVAQAEFALQLKRALGAARADLEVIANG